MKEERKVIKLKAIQKELPELCNNFLSAGLAKKADLTRFNYAKDIKYFLEYALDYYPYFESPSLKEMKIEEVAKITPLDIDRYLSYMSDRGYSDKTIARRKSSISSLFKYLVYTEQVLEKNPVQGSTIIHVEQPDTVIYLNREDQNKLLNTVMYGTGLSDNALKKHPHYCKRDLAIIFLFLDTGMRISELQRLNIKDVDLQKNELYTIRKGRQRKTPIFFSDEAEEYIREYLDERKAVMYPQSGDPLFLSNRGTRISVRNIEAMLDKYVDAAFGSGKHISPHKLRSSFAMEFYRSQNGDILMLQSRMGHKSIVSTNVYAKAFEKEAIKETRNWRNK